MSLLSVAEVDMELHGIFWFHSAAQPRDKYTHISLPIVHNYPLTLAFLGKPVDSSFVSVSGLLNSMVSHSAVWRDRGFYVYPAVGKKIISKTLTFSMGSTGYVSLKPQTRASVPDFASNQVFLPGSVFRTYVIIRGNYRIPRIIRLGSKRFGEFVLKEKKLGEGEIRPPGDEGVTHPFNAVDCPAKSYRAIMRHYAGPVAISGIPERVVKVGDVVLAVPLFAYAPD